MAKRGAGGGTRTHTTLPSRDFKSLASTSSATSAYSSVDQTLSAFVGQVELEVELGYSAPDRALRLRECTVRRKASMRTSGPALGNLNVVRLRRSDVRLLAPAVFAKPCRAGAACARGHAFRLRRHGRHHDIRFCRSRQIRS